LGAKIAVNLVLAAHSVSRTLTTEKKKSQFTDKCYSDEIPFLGGMWDDFEMGEGGVGVIRRIPICLRTRVRAAKHQQLQVVHAEQDPRIFPVKSRDPAASRLEKRHVDWAHPKPKLSRLSETTQTAAGRGILCETQVNLAQRSQRAADATSGGTQM
jgi:hypothetical protein